MSDGLPGASWEFENEHYLLAVRKFDAERELGRSSSPWPATLGALRRVTFEISNICNYANQHRKCPASWAKRRLVLPASIVQRCLTELGEAGFSGIIAFHRYNEPLIDPRFGHFVGMARARCPDASIVVLTNGFVLCQQMLDDLGEMGVRLVTASAYSKREFERLSAMNASFPYRVFLSRSR